MTDHKNINIVETTRDTTMYAPTRVVAQVASALPYAIMKGVIGARRRALESTSYMDDAKTKGVTTLDITEGIRDIGTHEGEMAMAALESWKNENPDKKILSYGDASGALTKNMTITWEQKPGANTPSYEKKANHFPIKKSNKKNVWMFWRGLNAVGNAIPFAFKRILGRNKTAAASKPMTIDQESGLKQVSLQVTPGIGDYSFRNNAFLINEAIVNWKKQNPNTQITRVATSNTGAQQVSDDSAYFAPGKVNISILYK